MEKLDTSQLFLRHHPKDLSKLVASQWSAIFFYNTDGSVPSNPDDNTPTDNNTNDDPPPGLPPQPDNDQDMNDSITHHHHHLNHQTKPMPDDPHTPTNGIPPGNDDDPFHAPFQSPPRLNDDPDEERHSPQAEPEIPVQPSQPPGFPPTPFPGSNAIPVSPDTLIVPNTIIPPNVEDTPMTHRTKRPPDDPPAPPATKARPSRQMPASSSSQFQPSNRLGGDTQPSVTPNATPQPATVAPSVSNAQNAPKKPKDVAVPDDFDDDEPDPDAGPSGHNGPPVLPIDGDEPFHPDPMPTQDPTPDESVEQEEEEKNEEETDETIPYGSKDTDETLDYNDLVIDDSQWCLLAQEQKLCSNTASFSVPRLIDGSPVAVGTTESSNAISMSYSIISDRQRQRCRKTRSDIIEEYHGIKMTLYSVTDKFAYLVGKERKEATQHEKRQLAKQFLEAKKAECQS